MLASIPLKPAFAIMTGLAASVIASSAALVPAPVSGDLYLGFRADGGSGGSVSYIVKLGQDTVFQGVGAGSTIAVSGLGNIASDLSATYGAAWSSRTDLFWGVFGVRSSASSVVYGSRARTSSSSSTVAWPALDLTSRNSTASQITSVLESVGGYRSLSATSNSPVAAFQQNSSEASSYASQVGTPGTSDFGTLSGWTSIEGAVSSGAGLDLFRIAGSGVTTVGTFKISSTGAVSFTGNAVVALAPDIAIEQPVGTSLVDGTAKKLFGTVVVGNKSTVKTFTIRNTGTANLTWLAVTKNGLNPNDFIVTAPLLKSLAPGATTTFKVTFAPTATGTRNARIHVKSNDPDENPFDIILKGFAVSG